LQPTLKKRKKRRSVFRSLFCNFDVLIVERLSDFNPTVSNKEPSKSKSKTGLIVGIVVAVMASGLFILLALLFWRHKIKKNEMDAGTIVNVLII
jgi:hypothetical protein